MAIDVPALIILALRTINKIGLCYGYTIKSKEDEEFMLGILSLASANSVEEKAMALTTLKQIEMIIAKQTWKKITQSASAKQLSKEGGIIAIKSLVKQLGINITKRKALASIPLIGVGIGGSMNAWYIREIGWVARRMYQEKWLLENKKIKKPV